MFKSLLHIHLCVGGLGLSLPIPVISKKVNTIMINRKKDKNNERYKFFESIHKNNFYYIKYKKRVEDGIVNDYIPEEFQKKRFKNEKEKVTNFTLIDNDLEDTLPIKKDIDGKNLFITLSPDGKGRNYAIKKLKDILDMADIDSFIFVVSCENGKRISSSIYKNNETIKEICNSRKFKHLYFLDCVVDRLVPEKWGIEEINKENDILSINTEEYFKWIIEYPIWNENDEIDGINLLKSLFDPEFNNKAILIDHGDYEKEYYLKTFCINGLHYAIAILQEYNFIKLGDDQLNVNLVLNKSNNLYNLVNGVIENIKNSLVNNPRQIRIVYYIPRYSDLLKRQNWLTLEAELNDGRCLIWRNKF